MSVCLKIVINLSLSKGTGLVDLNNMLTTNIYLPVLMELRFDFIDISAAVSRMCRFIARLDDETWMFCGSISLKGVGQLFFFLLNLKNNNIF